MKRGPIIHGVLLVVALLFAYQTFTREEKTDREVGDVSIWSVPRESITAVNYDSKDHTVTLERRGQGGDSYFWGKDIRTTHKPKPAPPPTSTADGGASEPPVLVVPETEDETKTREFAVGKQATDLIENLADLRALRSLGELDETRRKDYGLHESTDNITVTVAGKTRSLVIGERVPGSEGGRYVLDPETKRGYAVAGSVINDLLSGEPGLRLRKPHLYEDDDVGKVSIDAGGKIRKLVRITVDEEGRKTKSWADAAAPDKPDQTMLNFLQNIAKLNPSEYVVDVDPSTLTLLAKITYQRDSGKELGWIEVYEQVLEQPSQPPPATPAKPDEAKPAESPAKPAADPAKPGETKPAASPAKPGETKPAADPAKPGEAKPAASPAKPGEAKPAADPAKPGEAKPAADPAKPAESLPPPRPSTKTTYFIRTEATHIHAEVAANIASRIKEDIKQIFAQ